MRKVGPRTNEIYSRDGEFFDSSNGGARGSKPSATQGPNLATATAHPLWVHESRTQPASSRHMIEVIGR
jgi:hypothetical protein